VTSQATTQVRSLIAYNIDRGIRAKGLTNRGVGDAIGRTEHQVWRWRHGKHMPSVAVRTDLAAVLFEGDMTELYADNEERAA
jgi:transcriptional regulator with XRE-family HTH domain